MANIWPRVLLTSPFAYFRCVPIAWLVNITYNFFSECIPKEFLDEIYYDVSIVFLFFTYMSNQIIYINKYLIVRICNVNNF